MVVGRSAIFAKPHRHSIDASATSSKLIRRHGEASKVKSSKVGRRKKSENRRTIESSRKSNKQHEEDMERYVINNQQQHHSNQQQYHGIARGEQITPKKGANHEEMPLFDLHAVIFELAKRKKNSKDRMAILINDDKTEQQQQQQQQGFSDESFDGPSNFNNYRRRLID
ncbi:Flap endonuclease [Dirofilaria immitis]